MRYDLRRDSLMSASVTAAIYGDGKRKSGDWHWGEVLPPLLVSL